MQGKQKILLEWISRNFELPKTMNNTRRVQDIDLMRFFEKSNPQINVSLAEIRNGFREAGFRVNESSDLGFVVGVRRTDYRTTLRRFLK